MSSHGYWKPIILTVMVLASASGCATRRDVTTIDSRVSEIELREAEDRRRRDEIAKSREANEQALRQMSASLRAQIDELRDEVRGLRGRLEELDHSLRQKPAAGETGERPRDEKLSRLEDANTQLAQRLSRVEEHLRLAPVPPSRRLHQDQTRIFRQKPHRKKSFTTGPSKPSIRQHGPSRRGSRN
jgi:TolA-binding protein